MRPGSSRPVPGKKSSLCRVSCSLRTAKRRPGIERLGIRFRRFCSTAHPSGPFHPGCFQNVSWLDAFPAHGLWRDHLYPLSRDSAFACCPPLLYPQEVSNSSFTSAAGTAPSEVGSENRAGKRARFFYPSAKTRRQVQGVDTTPQKEDRPEMDLPPDNPPGTLASQSSIAPQLHRRGDPSAAGSKGSPSQTIALLDTDAKGQPVKSGGSKQAIQQTATAALGVYKRVSSVDRH